jgi:uncharacterized membrane protein YfcA
VTGIFTRYILILSFVALPGMFAGFFLGYKADTKLSETAIRRIIITIFMFGGLSILVKALFWRT